jgi:hypothetical protein
VSRVGTLVLLAALATPAALAGADQLIPDALVVLEAPVSLPGRVGDAAPPRFVLMRGGSVFVGGSEDVYATVLAKDEQKAIEERLKDLRKAGQLVPKVAFGDDATRQYRLRVFEGGAVEVVMTGDPATAPQSFAPLAAFVRDLLSFDHPGLRPYVPDAYALRARPGDLVGGCRAWAFSVPLSEVIDSPRRIAPQEAAGWPTGASAASVCAGARPYVVTLRPLLPGQQP